MFRVDPQAQTRSPPAPAAFPRTKRIIPPPRFANAHAEAMRRVQEDAIRAESLSRDQSTAPSPPASNASSSDSESDSDAEGDAHHASFAAKPAYVSLFFGWFGATAKQAIPADLQFDTTDADSSKPPNRRCYPPEAVWKAQMAREKAAAAAARPPHTSRQVFPPAPEPTIRHSSRRSYPPVPDAEATPPPPPTPPVTPSPTRPTPPPPPPPPRGKRLYKTTSLNRDEMKEQLFRERSERNRRIQEEEALRNADEARRRDECGPAQDAEPQRDAAQRQRDKEERRLRERDAQRQRERELRQAERQRQREAERRRQREVEAQRKREADAERARLAAEAERLRRQREAERLRRQREAEAEQATQQERWRRLEEQMRNLRENLERAKTEREREERGHKDDPRTRAEEEAARLRERAAEEARRRAQRLRREESAFKRMAGRWEARERHRSAAPLKRTPTPTAPLTPRERYDVLWARLLSPIEPDARPFTFATFPWPGGRSLAEIARFLLPAAGGREKHIIRQQLKRWHPDKFAAVAQGRVVDADRQRVLEGQIAVVQALNELLSRF